MRCDFYWPGYVMKPMPFLALFMLIYLSGGCASTQAEPPTEHVQIVDWSDSPVCISNDYVANQKGVYPTVVPCPENVPPMPLDWLDEDPQQVGTCTPANCSTPMDACDPCPEGTCCWIKYCGTLGCERACWVC